MDPGRARAQPGASSWGDPRSARGLCHARATLRFELVPARDRSGVMDGGVDVECQSTAIDAVRQLGARARRHPARIDSPSNAEQDLTTDQIDDADAHVVRACAIELGGPGLVAGL